MSNHPGEPVPAEMPRDLGRVYAALEVPLDPAPKALLDRILSSRAAGGRALLPVERPRSSLLPRRLLRGAIAAGLGLVVLATWSRWSRPTTDMPDTTSVAALGFPIGDEFGLTTPALAQGVFSNSKQQEPRFGAMTFDTARLHPMRLRYSRRTYYNGLPSDDGTVIYTLSRRPDRNGEWVLAMERTMGDGDDTAELVDTIRLEQGTLRTLSEVYRVTFQREHPAFYRWTMGDSVIEQHSEITVWPRSRPRPGGETRRNDSADGPAAPTRTTAQGRLPQERADAGQKPSDRDSLIVSDTVYRVQPSRFPKVLSAMNGGFETLVKLMAAPIDAGWKRSMLRAPPGGTMVREGVRQAVIPMDFEVVGQERIASPGGPADCWKLRWHDQTEITYWVRKRDGMVVSSRISGKINGRTLRAETTLIEER